MPSILVKYLTKNNPKDNPKDNPNDKYTEVQWLTGC